MKNRWMIGFEWIVTGVALLWVVLLAVHGEDRGLQIIPQQDVPEQTHPQGELH